ncbi:MAG: hypothetical protein KZQ83_01320 [gamma proteobacterium symbiont of Taylorina sp.]|nr:hypothetical protein [gamma proteobacterium symbiont of Taylorina sp.]
MDILSIIIIGVAALLLADGFLIHYVRKKRKGSFKLVIEKGIITENQGNIPSEFLYDIQQLSRMSKPDSLIINGSGIESSEPSLEFLGNISVDLKEKIKHSLTISLQKK